MYEILILLTGLYVARAYTLAGGLQNLHHVTINIHNPLLTSVTLPLLLLLIAIARRFQTMLQHRQLQIFVMSSINSLSICINCTLHCLLCCNWRCQIINIHVQRASAKCKASPTCACSCSAACCVDLSEPRVS